MWGAVCWGHRVQERGRVMGLSKDYTVDGHKGHGRMMGERIKEKTVTTFHVIMLNSASI